MKEPLSVVCFKWQPHPASRVLPYTAAHVNRLSEMVWANLSVAHRFYCVTDDSRGLSSDIIPIELWSDHAGVVNPNGAREPRCYRRLKLFSKQAEAVFGSRILWLDLDMVVTRDLAPMLSRTESVVLLSTEVPNIPVNGSTVLLTPGAEAHVWEDFDPNSSPRKAASAGFFGSDQGWLGYKLPGAGKWKAGPGGDGVYFFHDHVRRHGAKATLPEDARIFSFHGRAGKPWDPVPQSFDWVRHHYGRFHEGQRIQA